jgi:hypothetical protein
VAVEEGGAAVQGGAGVGQVEVELILVRQGGLMIGGIEEGVDGYAPVPGDFGQTR